MSDNAGNPFEGAPIIFAYTRKMALVDGVLCELKEAPHQGFKIHTACTERVWASLIAWPFATNKEGMQRIREEALLRAAFLSVRTKIQMERAGVPDAQPDRCDFHVQAVIYDEGEPVTRDVQLYMMIGPGDTPEPVATVMFPDED